MNPGDRLGHYLIRGVIGAGGMGTVYRAIDTRLDREVAFKVLPREMAADPERLDRFRREAKAVAALNHANIVTLYSVEEVDGVHFLTMELVEGEPLSHRVAAGGLPIDQLIDVATALVDALVAAHAKGIVHRDLKPANVMQTESGVLKVLDFGLAKVSGAGVAAESETALLTQEGVVLGTPAYMSPEQLSGRDVDHRTDMFSSGVLLYELATGRRPFAGSSSAELASSILRDAPPPLTTLRPALPAEFDRIIRRCLEKDPARRYGTTAALASDVSAMAALVRSSVPAAGVEAGRSAAEDLGPSVAVLPFRNMSADPENDYFSDGLAEEILSALSQIKGLRVAARTSSFSFKGQGASVAEICSALHVGHVLEGGVRRAGNRIRVTAQLVDASNGFQVWSERYDRELADIFDVQDDIARAIAARLEVTIGGSQANRLVKAATKNMEAYDLNLKGRALLLKRGRSIAQGAECLERAVALDPGYAAAWAGLAEVHVLRGYWGIDPPARARQAALAAARRAVALDANSGEAHCALASATLIFGGDYEEAIREYRLGLELSPAYTQGRCWFGIFALQWIGGRHEEGIAEARRALEGDPLSAYATSIMALAASIAGRTAEGLNYARLGVERDADALLSHWTHGLCAHWDGRFDESNAAFDTASTSSDRGTYVLAMWAVLMASWGKPAEAKAFYEELRARATREYLPRSVLGVAAAAAGEQDVAMQLAKEALDDDEPSLRIFARNFPSFQLIRDDPRSAEILKGLKLPNFES